ncbi:hypothetical protein JDV02_010017 [Purpureocillium takamizusanense]|uniref:Uncharacterized protein n=1 Tax=Purpureocillium takamizusanense TaxID=2060973 RepID=A0A9Q8QT89_9HYPO|nr:uncharacterized protein JDV02_010017 [Purpureocillium takamizusanense]UNI24254.1 hypothetical protein JDV02_010017 [Purpureocillium takamizusanense]
MPSLTWPSTFDGTISATLRSESTDCSEDMMRLTPTPSTTLSLPTSNSERITSTVVSVQSLASSEPCSNSSSSYTSTFFTSTTSSSTSSCTDETSTSSSTQNYSTTTSSVSTDCESSKTSSTQRTQSTHDSASVRQATTNTTSTTESSRTSIFTSQTVVLNTGPAEYMTSLPTPPAYLPPLNEYSFLSTPPLYGSSISSLVHDTVFNTGARTIDTASTTSTRETTQAFVYGQTTATSGASRQQSPQVFAASATVPEMSDEGIAGDPQSTGYAGAALKSRKKQTGAVSSPATASLIKGQVIQVTIVSLGANGMIETSVMAVQQDAPLPTGLALIADPPEETGPASHPSLRRPAEATAPSPHGLSSESFQNEPSTLKRVEGETHTFQVTGETAAMMEATPMVVTGSSTAKEPLRTATRFAVGLAVLFLGGAIAV